jgi:hypothetical protein
VHDRRLLIEPLEAAGTVRGTGLLMAATTIRSGENGPTLVAIASNEEGMD